ncbi:MULTISPECIES: hypothetical protein [Ciceribacter]|uniref:Uncharacterized protein n=1 Tax=Ciceribacter lividus TaxID=1197950 RepID=A0A6I7HLU7_9HYPH|nr:MULTISPECIES: hypothetical protein [Ciceribacter]MCO6176874.1 hypothetical protein [Ciceribacter sp. RN22]RCW23278.1 hypothetical protein DFR48_107148 [Ciceribacter lividus]
MAEIVKLEERLARQPKRRVEHHEAVILLFTGVRYEYRDGHLIRTNDLFTDGQRAPQPKGKDPLPH